MQPFGNMLDHVIESGFNLDGVVAVSIAMIVMIGLLLVGIAAAMVAGRLKSVRFDQAMLRADGEAFWARAQEQAWALARYAMEPSTPVPPPLVDLDDGTDDVAERRARATRPWPAAVPATRAA